MFFLHGIIQTIRIFLAVGSAVLTRRLVGTRVDCGGFVEMEKLAPFAILAEAIVFEVGAYFGFVVLVEGLLVSQFVLVVGKGALPNHRITESLKGQYPRSYQ